MIKNIPRASLPKPPAADQAAAREWAAGWWAGIAVGLVNGVAAAVLYFAR